MLTTIWLISCHSSCSIISNSLTMFSALKEMNQASLALLWNPDNLIEDLWKYIEEIQPIVISSSVPTVDVAVILIALVIFESSGLFLLTTKTWRIKPVTFWAWTTFKSNFTITTAKCWGQTTTWAAGYYSVHTDTPAPAPVQASIIDIAALPIITPPHVTVNNKKCTIVGCTDSVVATATCLLHVCTRHGQTL